ncbi:MAG: hypothetical protein AB8B80_00810 [Marinicellaceae bacterium]
MYRLIALLFLMLSLSSLANTGTQPPLIKVFQEDGNVRIGIYVSCPYYGLSNKASPNIIITENNKHFDIIMSLRPPFGVARCSPLPPKFWDSIRQYYDLGELGSGTYTITAKYVSNNQSLPPSPGVPIYDFDQTGFTVAHSVPLLNNLGWLIFLILLIMMTFKSNINLFKNDADKTH